MIDDIVEDLRELWPGITVDMAEDIKYAMANYALCALMDSCIREEAVEVCDIKTTLKGKYLA